MIKSRLVLIPFILFFFLCGCAQPSTPTASPSATYTALPTATATHSPTPTSTVTVTASPTATPTATTTPTSTPSVTPSNTPVPLVANVTLSRLEIVQGQVAEIRVVANEPCQVSASLETRSLPFVSRDGLTHWGLLSVHALAATGQVPITLTVSSAGGKQLTLATFIQVLDGAYESENLDFDEETEKLLDPKVTEPELWRIAAVYGESAPDKGWTGTFAWPLQGRITSLFGTRRNYDGYFSSYHSGLDLGSTGDDVIRAPANGVVRLAEQLQVRGNAVIIDHGAGVLTGYYHLAQIDVVPGQAVTRGDPLGLMGATGLVTGKHLHWELRVGGIAVNPVLWTEFPFLTEMDTTQLGG